MTILGQLRETSKDEAQQAIEWVHQDGSWQNRPVSERCDILDHAADLFAEHSGELLALLSREAGKTLVDAISELREAIDFLRYYAHSARCLAEQAKPRGIIVCISPWNFPLAIFTGQVAAALAAGNRVLAKPAEQTPCIATRVTSLLLQAGVDFSAICLLPGSGEEIGKIILQDSRIQGVCFTGSNPTAQAVDISLAKYADPAAMLIAETGGVNAMLVDSSALPEQAVADIIQSAFQSAGQRCSALRLLLLQEEIADTILGMLEGAIREWSIGNPWELSTDIGPVIDSNAKQKLLDYCLRMDNDGKQIFRIDPEPAVQSRGHFVGPAVYRLNQIEDLKDEVFGPVLHVVTYAANALDSVIDKINASGFGLTLGMHSRVDNRMHQVCNKALVGNIYLNRNQIGAVVGVQPFGGENLSGTGPKAGGPFYLLKLLRQEPIFKDYSLHQWPPVLQKIAGIDDGSLANSLQHVASRCCQALAEQGDLPGPTGERNSYSLHPRGRVLCLGDDVCSPEILLQQCLLTLAADNQLCLPKQFASQIKKLTALLQIAGLIDRLELITGEPIALCKHQRVQLVVYDGSRQLRNLRLALASRYGARIGLISSQDSAAFYFTERVISEDTTAAGGNASLLASI